MQHEQSAQQAAEEEPRPLAQGRGPPHRQDQELRERVQPRHPENAGEHEEKSVGRQLCKHLVDVNLGVF